MNSKWKDPPRKAAHRPKPGDRWSNAKETREVFDVYDAGRNGYLVRFKYVLAVPVSVEGIGRCNGYDWQRWIETAKEVIE